MHQAKLVCIRSLFQAVTPGLIHSVEIRNKDDEDFPGGAVVKNPPANVGDTVLSLVREDPTCHRATKPVCHNYGACALEPASHNY